MKTIGDSIEYTQLQVGEEEANLLELQEKVESGRFEVEDKRRSFDEKRSGLDNLRNRYQQIQRNQFDAEKKVAVADTSIQNLQRAHVQLSDEKQNREQQLQQLLIESDEKEATLAAKRVDLQQLQEHQEKTKEQILANN